MNTVIKDDATITYSTSFVATHKCQFKLFTVERAVDQNLTLQLHCPVYISRVVSLRINNQLYCVFFKL
jgi:hypothetical protein